MLVAVIAGVFIERYIVFTTDSRTENFLKSLGIKFSYRRGIKLPADFAPGWDTENLGRPVAVREDAVLEYAALMKDGSAAPAPILIRTGRGYKILDGVQRTSAADLLELLTISAYVVETTSDDMISAVRVLANARMQGRAESAEWTRRRAVEVLVVGRSMSITEVSKMGGWKAADIERLAAAIELQERITNVGGPELTDVTLAELRPYLTQREILEQATVPVVGFIQTIKQSRMSANDAVPYISTFFAPFPKTSNPYKVFSARLKGLHEDPEIQSRLTGRQQAELPKDIVLLRTLKSADTVLDRILTRGENVANVDEFFRILDRITRKLKSISNIKRKQLTKTSIDK